MYVCLCVFVCVCVCARMYACGYKQAHVNVCTVCTYVQYNDHVICNFFQHCFKLTQLVPGMTSTCQYQGMYHPQAMTLL